MNGRDGMAGRVEVTPGQLRRVAGDMGELRRRVHRILDDLESALAERGAAWGGDGYGSTFADGETGYLAAHQNLKTGMQNVASTLGSYAAGQYRSADLLERQDLASGKRLRG
ncbi:WXG100 family type VII secretion target [Nocardia brasiliensis]|uniref:WXG100 family type VII secretion target n=1 Tax=Nocardia brasiliensis TaxID=37326 RepID=UPI00366B6F13